MLPPDRLPRIAVIVNRGGGSAGEADAARLHEAFAVHGIDPEIRIVAPRDLDEVCAAAARREGCDVLVAAGGDGTIGAAAGALAGTGRPLGILPLGTLNHFARDAGIPLDLDAAIAVIAAGHRRRVDVAEVNGRVFVNNSALGLYPEMVRFRDAEQARTGHGKRLAMLRAALRALRSFHRRRLLVSAAGAGLPLRTPLLMVGNNRYRVDLFALGRREALDRGQLCLYAVRARNRLHLLWAGLRGLLGGLDQQRDFLTLCAETIDIASERPALTLSLDGETLTLATPLRYRIRPGDLVIVAPVPEAREG
ncbi:diacylglycerol kinase family lipid kinase [Sphingomonas parva]|uniref:Diacylglycerol kinase family lipid kinase n=1 Tax=Sphingomonas parva TaxID=2555898 RepID=A0A4Y8ZN84_9SPHN|nr:diacylglycerol kinase family protein [Sphingomonas parva]TFI57451.1 diacylglycerol kinase family lipid kinase [Sphingomonas parva]